MATSAGFQILESGGNAVDAGCAAGIVLGVLQSELVNFALVEHFPRFEVPSKLFSNSDWQLDQDGCIALPREAGLGISINESSLLDFEYQASPIREWPDY